MFFNKKSHPLQNNTPSPISIGGVTFTQREVDVIACIINGRTSKKNIASFLSISPKTVTTHTRHIMQKLHCTSWEFIPAFIEKCHDKYILEKRFNQLLITSNQSQKKETEINQETIYENPFKKRNRFPLYYILIVSLFILFLAMMLVQNCVDHSYTRVIQSEIKLPEESILLKRTKLLDEINTKFIEANQDTIPVVCLIGMGGSGKTTLARMWGKQFSHDNKKAPIWELNAETNETLQNSLKNLAISLAKTEQQKLDLDLIQAIQDEREKTKRLFSFIQTSLCTLSKWALIFDNVDSLAHVKEYIPQNTSLWGNGHILITTRNDHFNHTDIIPSKNIITLGALSLEDAYTLFTKQRFSKTSQNISQQEKQAIQNFITHIPLFPLDITVSAKYIKYNNISYDEYLIELENQKKDFYKVQTEMLKETSTYIKTRYSILTLAFKQIIEIDPKFSDLFMMISIIDSQNIPRKLLERHYDTHTLNRFISELKKHSLITEEGMISTLSTFSIHRSTQDICHVFFMQNFDLTPQHPSIISIGNTFEGYLNDLIDVENYVQISLIVPHCKNIINSHLLPKTMKGVISVTLGWTFFCLGKDALAHQFLEEGICDLKSGRGTENRIQNQETTSQKNIDALIPALSHVEKQKYSEDIHIVRATSYLGIVALRGGQLEKSKKILEWCKPIYQLSYDYVGYTRVLTFLAHLYTLLNDYQKSEKYFLASIAFCRKHNVRKANLARALAFLGFLYREEGKFEQAKAVLSESADLYKEGILHVWAIAHKAGIETELGNYEVAKKMLENTIRVYKEKKAAQHVSLGWICPYLGSIYRKIGKYKEAKDLFLEGVHIYKNAESDVSVNLGTPFPLVHLGKLYRKMGLYDLSYTYLSKAQQEHLKIFGENNARTLWGDMALADLYIDLHKYNEAKKLIEKCLIYYKKTLLPNHPKIGKALGSLATTYSKLGDTQKAEPLFKQSLEILEIHYGPNHIETTTVLRQYGDHLIKTNHLDKAHDYLTQANNILLTHHHPDICLSMVTLATLYAQKAKTGIESTENKNKAALALREALKYAVKSFPENAMHIQHIQELIKQNQALQ